MVQGHQGVSAWSARNIFCGAVAVLSELAPLSLPGRTPGIEDVLYALCGGYLGVSVTRLSLYRMTAETV
jgi:VanZ family protein